MHGGTTSLVDGDAAHMLVGGRVSLAATSDDPIWAISEYTAGVGEHGLSAPRVRSLFTSLSRSIHIELGCC